MPTAHQVALIKNETMVSRRLPKDTLMSKIGLKAMIAAQPFLVTAPGRVCLFGEHSDYIGLPVIPGAIDRCITISGKPGEGSEIRVLYSDLKQADSFRIGENLSYRQRRDYLRSAFNVVARQGLIPRTGAELAIAGNIPIAGGLSSSSALTVASVMTAAHLAGEDLDPERLANLAFQAEVREFGESGGMMDHFASAYGGLIHVDCGRQNKLTRIAASLDGLVIGDSQEKKKDTVGDLTTIRATVEDGYRRLSKAIPGFNQRETPLKLVSKHIDTLPLDCRLMTLTTIRNRDLTARALKVLSSKKPDPRIVGSMLNEHHVLLRDGLHRSTARIEELISAAKAAGALGCKINGSGGGGTMFAYAPGHEKEVAEAIRKVGGIPYLTRIGQGAKLTAVK